MARIKDMLLEGQRLGIDMTQPDALERTLAALESERAEEGRDALGRWSA